MVIPSASAESGRVSGRVLCARVRDVAAGRVGKVREKKAGEGQTASANAMHAGHRSHRRFDPLIRRDPKSHQHGEANTWRVNVDMVIIVG